MLIDEIIELTGEQTKNKYTKPLRRIAIWNDEHGYVVQLLTNNFKLSASTIAQLYKVRWMIEIFFRAMKSSGFNIEDTYLRDRGRIVRLFAMVCMVLVWAYLVGEPKDIYVKPIKILKQGRRAKSLVKYGLEEILNVLFRPTYTPKFDVFKFLLCT